MTVQGTGKLSFPIRDGRDRAPGSLDLLGDCFHAVSGFQERLCAGGLGPTAGQPLRDQLADLLLGLMNGQFIASGLFTALNRTT
jgi:hypothetical protein